MASTFGSIAESQVTVDTTITSIISEVQEQWGTVPFLGNLKVSICLHGMMPIIGEESVADPEETAKKKIKAWINSMIFLLQPVFVDRLLTCINIVLFISFFVVFRLQRPGVLFCVVWIFVACLAFVVCFCIHSKRP